jgi:hypothetical protein
MVLTNPEVSDMSETFDGNPIIGKWEEIKSIMETLEADVAKNARGIAAAGVRSRKGLRALKTKASELVKAMVETDKARRAAAPKKERKAKQPA